MGGRTCGTPVCSLRDGHEGVCEPDRREGRRTKMMRRAETEERQRQNAAAAGRQAKPGEGAVMLAEGLVCRERWAGGYGKDTVEECAWVEFCGGDGGQGGVSGNCGW